MLQVNLSATALFKARALEPPCRPPNCCRKNRAGTLHPQEVQTTSSNTSHPSTLLSMPGGAGPLVAGADAAAAARSYRASSSAALRTSAPQTPMPLAATGTHSSGAQSSTAQLLHVDAASTQLFDASPFAGRSASESAHPPGAPSPNGAHAADLGHGAPPARAAASGLGLGLGPGASMAVASTLQHAHPALLQLLTATLSPERRTEVLAGLTGDDGLGGAAAGGGGGGGGGAGGALPGGVAPASKRRASMVVGGVWGGGGMGGVRTSRPDFAAAGAAALWAAGAPHAAGGRTGRSSAQQLAAEAPQPAAAWGPAAGGARGGAPGEHHSAGLSGAAVAQVLHSSAHAPGQGPLAALGAQEGRRRRERRRSALEPRQSQYYYEQQPPVYDLNPSRSVGHQGLGAGEGAAAAAAGERPVGTRGSAERAAGAPCHSAPHSPPIFAQQHGGGSARQPTAGAGGAGVNPESPQGSQQLFPPSRLGYGEAPASPARAAASSTTGLFGGGVGEHDALHATTSSSLARFQSSSRTVRFAEDSGGAAAAAAAAEGAASNGVELAPGMVATFDLLGAHAHHHGDAGHRSASIPALAGGAFSSSSGPHALPAQSSDTLYAGKVGEDPRSCRVRCWVL